MSFFTGVNPTPNLAEKRGLTDADLINAMRTVCERNGYEEDLANSLVQAALNAADSELLRYFHSRRLLEPVVKDAQIVLPIHLNDTEKSALREYGVGYDLKFVDGYCHDHPMAAAMRAIDYAVTSEYLGDQGYNDIGGNPLYYMRSGETRVHVCNPIVDVKDRSRAVVRKRAMRALITREKDPQRRLQLDKWMDPQSGLLCDKTASDCQHKSSYLRSIHVYDIPIDQWADIMDSKEAHTVVGCMLFDSEMYYSDAGMMPLINAQWEIDREQDIVKMGFSGSRAWWYRHKFSDYVRYGETQLLRSVRGNSYLYRIFSKRDSTIYFKITRTQVSVRPPMHCVSSGPKLVQVEGYDVNVSLRCLKKKFWTFPQRLWETMVNWCSLRYEKGTLRTNEAFNAYRTMVARQSVNGVLVSGGERLPDAHLGPFVAHACIAAAIMTITARKETRYLTTTVVEARASVLSKLVRNLTRLVDPLQGEFPVAAWLRELTDVALADKLVSSFTVHPATQVVGIQTLEVLRVQPQTLFATVAEADPVEVEVWRSNVLKGYLTKPVPIHKPCDLGSLRSIIEEHVSEVEAENRVIKLALANKMLRFLRSGDPDKGLLRDYSEDDRNPDFIRFDKGKFHKRSAMGRPLDTIEAAAFMTNAEQIFLREEVPDSYSGWLFFTDDLNIYNGPGLVEGLKRALQVEASKPSVILHSGPPGCGKTTSIVREFDRETDVVLCPVKESIVDTAKKLVASGKILARESDLYARTVDSFLMHGLSKPMVSQPLRILFDEAFMTHSAKIYAAALLLGVAEIHAYGDPKQIPHVTRSDFLTIHSRLKPDHEVPEYISYRCPPEAVASWNHLYGGTIRSASKLSVPMWQGQKEKAGKPDSDVVFLVMYQADKKDVKAYFGNAVKVLSVHEAQGKTFSKVWLLRTDARPRTDKVSLFDRDEYVLVALSRHTHEFKYLRARDVGDSVSKFISRVNAESVEKAKQGV